MAYSEKSAARLAALHGEIEARKEHEFAAPTYRDAAALAEIRQTVFNQLESEHEHDRDTVEDSIAVLRYLAENYENMGRTACALPLRKKVLELDAEFAARFGNSEAFVDENTEEASAVREGIESDYYCALKARNRYGRDECADLREIAAGLLPLDKQIQIEKNVFENYEPTSAFGTKALGEPPACSPAPAIRNAIYHATGVAINQAPITPHVLFAKFTEAGLIQD